MQRACGASEGIIANVEGMWASEGTIANVEGMWASGGIIANVDGMWASIKQVNFMEGGWATSQGLVICSSVLQDCSFAVLYLWASCANGPTSW
ncbi:hypothetical protein CBR_g37221 [Chara braunii]|uniref:Uncharacterized protein n=1 Tax=Chara braunii TaxID=69332 RepID=A0A388LMG0_CHABU|nr:hypothetical protein CBR_g37221 [Chara braunii]|eukprot:GBG83508.1 hypothetical protein CBR_g37221 [Chara braunii]